MRAAGKHIVLTRTKGSDSTSSGLYLPEGMREKNVATVHSIGEDCELKNLKPGDKVIFATGRTVEIQGQEYIFSAAADILMHLDD